MTDKHRDVIDAALDAFWEVVVEHFPTATTGDLSPWTTIKLTLAAEAAIDEWVHYNVSPAGQ